MTSLIDTACTKRKERYPLCGQLVHNSETFKLFAGDCKHSHTRPDLPLYTIRVNSLSNIHKTALA
jgi:hypothetical protein